MTSGGVYRDSAFPRDGDLLTRSDCVRVCIHWSVRSHLLLTGTSKGVYAMPFQVDEVIGAGSVQQLVCQFIKLPCQAEEIKDIRKTVIVDNCLVSFDKVIIDGRLRKDIMFKNAKKGFPLPGTVQACVGVTATVSGPIIDVDVDIAFNALVPVPGALPGDKCVVLQAFVEGEKEEAADIDAHGAFSTLIDKSIIFLCVKVVRDVVTNGLVSTAAEQLAPLCPVRPSMGFFPGGNGLIPSARPGLIPGTFVGPTLIFPGVLNPGIPSLIPLQNNVVSTQGSIVQIAGPGVLATPAAGVPGASTGGFAGTL